MGSISSFSVPWKDLYNTGTTCPWTFSRTGFSNSGPGFFVSVWKGSFVSFPSFIDLKLSIYSILRQRWAQKRVRSTYCWENTGKQNFINELEFQLETKLWASSKLGGGRLRSWVERELHLRFSSLRVFSQTCWSGQRWVNVVLAGRQPPALPTPTCSQMIKPNMH